MKIYAFVGLAFLAGSILRAQSISILPLGDSITGTEIPSMPGAYRTELAEDLNKPDPSNNIVNYLGSNVESPTSEYLTQIDQPNNEGHPGYTIAHIYYNLTTDDGDTGNNGGYWLNGGNGTGRGPIDPDYITLNIGTNDVYLPGETSQDMLDSLKILLTDLKEDYVGMPGTPAQMAAQTLTNTQVIVSNLTPRTDNTQYAALEQGYDDGIKDLVASFHFANFHFLDINSTFPTSDLSSDGVHPNQAGYNIMGDDFAGEIERLQDAPEPGTLGLFLLGACMVAGISRYSKRSSAEG